MEVPHDGSALSRRPLKVHPLKAALMLALVALTLLQLSVGSRVRQAAAQTTCGSTNIASGRTAAASSTENSGTPASAAFDGSTTTRWSSAFSDPQWVRVDLGSSRPICRVQLLWENAYGRSYRIEVSNDLSTWTPISSTTTGDGGTDNIPGLNASGRYVRMYGTTRATGYGYSLWEMQVYASTALTTPTTSTRTNTRTATTSGATRTSTRTATRTATTQAATTHQVTMVDFAFQPASITIKAGDSVRWTNTGFAPHNAVSSLAGAWGSPVLNNNESGERTFTQAGTFNYFCDIHPSMTGTIVVTGGTGPSPTPTTPSLPTPSPTMRWTPVPTAPATSGGHGEFVALCPFSHRLPDDSIVFPNEPGRSHSHDFMGSTTSNAFSTANSLFAGGTSCVPSGDKSSYWVPTLYRANGEAVAISDGTFYYMSTHTNNPRAIQPFPFGLKVIAGNAAATGNQSPSYAEWFCLGAAGHSFNGPVVCPAGSKLQLLLAFPSCWDGRNLDSPNHKSHMAYSVAGACPSTHPVIVPRIEFKLTYNTTGETGMYLASGPGYTAHGDFYNAWDPVELERRVRNCSQRMVKCDVNGNPI